MNLKTILKKTYLYLIGKANKLKTLLFGLLAYIFRIFPIKSNKIVFSSFIGRNYGVSPAIISDYIIKNNKDIEIVWLINKNLDIKLPKEVKRVNNDSIMAIKELATAGVWVDSHLKFWWHRKRNKQLYIQTFHGCIAVKKVDADAPEKFDKNAMNRDRYNASIIDYYISNSNFCDRMYRSALLYNGEILKYGCPRNDLFFKDYSLISKKVKKALNIKNNQKIVLYAPTFRNNGSLQSYDINFQLLLNSLSDSQLGKDSDWCVVVRLHPLIAKKAQEMNIFSDRVIDGTSYPNMQELECASDIMISDYSSCIFDAAIMNKAGILYASDYDDYIDERGLYWDYFNLPFPVAQNNKELNDLIMSFDLDSYYKKIEKFKNDIGLIDDGKATERIYNLIMEHIS